MSKLLFTGVVFGRHINFRRAQNFKFVKLLSIATINNSQQNVEVSSVNSEDSSDTQNENTPWGDRIVYNTFLEKYRPPRSWRWEASEKWRKPMRDTAKKVELYSRDVPVALKYLEDLPANTSNNDAEKLEQNPDFGSPEVPQFPYKVHTSFDIDEKTQSDGFNTMEKVSQSQEEEGDSNQEINDDDEEEDDVRWEIQYGIPNPEIPASTVQCGGCGAYLHCQDTAIPGYMPSESFTAFTEKELKGEICQRCFYLKNHNAALNVNISPAVYPKILKQIEKHFAMVLLLVDLVDFPCSIWPNIVDIIGVKRPVLIVGNKVDLLPRDSKRYLQHIHHCLEKVIMESDLGRANIIGAQLISASTGFGIEELISLIYKKWDIKGDVFIMGCTNVGKSSLFNAFLQSDLCKVQVVDLVQRATISPWPGTTLNLLKFPIMKIQRWKSYYRDLRLKLQDKEYTDEVKLREMRLKKTRDPSYATLIGRVGRTFMSEEKTEAANTPQNENLDLFHVNPHSKGPQPVKKVGKWNPDDEKFVQGHWCYDTPGAVGENQLLDLFTLPELMKILPKTLIEPRSYFIKLGMTLFIGGVARIDFIDGLKPIRYTVFSSQSMPITVCETIHAEEVYSNALGSPIFGVPMGDKDRLQQFPPLKSQEFECEGLHHKESCADIVISSVGFVAVTVGIGKKCRLAVHTPNGKGIYFRQPSLLPHTINNKGNRIRDTPAYAHHRVYVPV